MEFEWDEEKNKANKQKHGINFSTASRIFQDMNQIELYDETHRNFEDRYATIGMVQDILFVVYTERKNRIRLISARLATKKERRIYYDRNIYSR